GTLTDRSAPVVTLLHGGDTTAAGSVHSVAVTSPLPADTTPPGITAAVVGTAGNNCWDRSRGTGTWTINDAESMTASSTGCGPTSLTSETAGTTLTCSATNAASLTQSVSVTIKIDKTGPVVSITRTAANSNGWNKTAVVVDFVANDALSGVSG